MEKYGDARLTEPRAFAIHDRCKAVYGKDSRF
jgi:hypothetical protein